MSLFSVSCYIVSNTYVLKNDRSSMLWTKSLHGHNFHSWNRIPSLFYQKVLRKFHQSILLKLYESTMFDNIYCQNQKCWKHCKLKKRKACKEMKNKCCKWLWSKWFSCVLLIMSCFFTKVNNSRFWRFFLIGWRLLIYCSDLSMYLFSLICITVIICFIIRYMYFT